MLRLARLTFGGCSRKGRGGGVLAQTLLEHDFTNPLPLETVIRIMTLLRSTARNHPSSGKWGRVWTSSCTGH